MKKVLPELILLFVLSLWLGSTIAVDFIAIPTVFRNVSDLEQAGAVGMNVFAQFNRLEFIFALASFACLLTAIGFNLQCLKRIESVLRLGSLSLLTALSAGYLFFLTPMLTAITLKKNSSFEEESRLILEGQLQFYHTLYVRLDSLKVLILLLALVITMLSIKKLFNREAV